MDSIFVSPLNVYVYQSKDPFEYLLADSWFTVRICLFAYNSHKKFHLLDGRKMGNPQYIIYKCELTAKAIISKLQGLNLWYK